MKSVCSVYVGCRPVLEGVCGLFVVCVVSLMWRLSVYVGAIYV